MVATTNEIEAKSFDVEQEATGVEVSRKEPQTKKGREPLV